ncbi:uncharacterized protein LOC123700679 isoform X1 [Colias croceus]|uniref:uncharacterized protein LOC123700679 isoform X1 n=1 Tax=Colias crocea TaxID=72248 RepID=UPI001E27B4BE|nr:uncharacterized protein LOC123700679 isoform X1 [Colias croceus]
MERRACVVWNFILFSIDVGSQLTPSLFDDTNREHINLAAYGDAEHRGQNWYAYESQNSGESGSYQRSSGDIRSSSLSSGSGSVSSSLSSEASSIETKERRRATKTYRQCTPCPQDMMKKYTNFGIKWICAAYQRARRSFKSECMMRYRNCQDGTMFVKISDKRCRNSTYHGRHWFYIYRV